MWSIVPLLKCVSKLKISMNFYDFPIKFLPKLLTIRVVMYRGFQGALNWAPLMPRDASLSDSYKSVGGGLLLLLLVKKCDTFNL